MEGSSLIEKRGVTRLFELFTNVRDVRTLGQAVIKTEFVIVRSESFDVIARTV